MTKESILLKLYILLVYSDGLITTNEYKMGQCMIKHEGIEEREFLNLVREYVDDNRNHIAREVVLHMKNLPMQEQLRFVAWMNLIANADGFIDNREWSFIYMVYSELGLSLSDIISAQHELKFSYQGELPRIALS